MSKKYVIQVNGQEVDSRSDKQAAQKLATKLAAEGQGSAQVITPAGSVVFTMSTAAKVQGGTGVRAKPYTRLDSEAQKMVAEGVVPEGWEVCYVRKRINVAVIRQHGMQGLRLIDATTGSVIEDVATTADASAVLVKMRKEAQAAKEAAKAEAKASDEDEAEVTVEAA